MTKQELFVQVDSKIASMFSDYKAYDSISNEALEKYDDYLKKNGKKPSISMLMEFLDENVLKHAISIAMKETINLLAENNLLQVDD